MSRNWKLPRQGDSEIATLLTEAAATRTNLLLQSEDFSTTWTNQNATSTFNQTTAPDGTTTADKLIDNAAVGANSVALFQNLTVTADTQYTYSVYLKADQLDWGFLQIANMGALQTKAFFDLTNGVVGATTGANNTSEFIQDVGNGWYRCGITFTSDAADTSISLYVNCADADNDSIVDLDGTSSIFLWGAQIEAGTSPTTYIPTTTTSAAVTGVTLSGNFQDDVHTALETVLQTTGATADLWKQYKNLT